MSPPKSVRSTTWGRTLKALPSSEVNAAPRISLTNGKHEEGSDYTQSTNFAAIGEAADGEQNRLLPDQSGQLSSQIDNVAETDQVDDGVDDCGGFKKKRRTRRKKKAIHQ